MEHFVTLFNHVFLPQGMALHQSMEAHIKEYVLWILCVDDKAYEVLNHLELSNVRLLKLSDLETEELLRVKKDRTIGEYCWTLTPFAPRFVFEADESVQRITYLDADMWFLKNPTPIFHEFEESKKQILITEHAYSPEQDQSATSGKYCVQFMIFNRTGAEVVRKWWEERCVEWCFARIEDGKFGDQKYLDDWKERFPEEVHVAQKREWFLAPWNATRFPYSEGIVWHFHSLRIEKKRIRWLHFYHVPRVTLKHIYLPYVEVLQKNVNKLRFEIIQGTPELEWKIFLIRIRCVFRKLWGACDFPVYSRLD